MSAQGNINYPHGTRTLIYAKGTELYGGSPGPSATSLTISFTDPATTDTYDLTLTLSSSWRTVQFPQNYTQLVLTWDTTPAPTIDLAAEDGYTHIAICTYVSDVRWWTVTYPRYSGDPTVGWLGSIIFINSHDVAIKVEVRDGDSVLLATHEIDPGAEAFIDNVGGWTHPDDTDLTKWFIDGGDAEPFYFKVYEWDGVDWVTKISNVTEVNRAITRVILIYEDDMGLLNFDVVGGFLKLVDYNPFLWGYFEPALPY